MNGRRQHLATEETAAGAAASVGPSAAPAASAGSAGGASAVNAADREPSNGNGKAKRRAKPSPNQAPERREMFSASKSMSRVY
jgi:hypothetical protein